VQLWVDRLGAERIHAVADLLSTRPVEPESNEPRLLVNDRHPIIDQLPLHTTPVDRLAVASPFFGPGAAALSALIPSSRTGSRRAATVPQRAVQGSGHHNRRIFRATSSSSDHIAAYLPAAGLGEGRRLDVMAPC
jgi:hypothetical protein